MNRLILKNSSNDLYLTVSERQMLVNPNYLFSFYSHSSKVTNNCIVPILSSNSRYDLFRLTESSNENLTGGTISLDQGFHNYYCYEQTSSTNLDHRSSNVHLLEQGLILVSGSTEEITYTGSTTELNFTFYTNQ